MPRPVNLPPAPGLVAPCLSGSPDSPPWQQAPPARPSTIDQLSEAGGRRIVCSTKAPASNPSSRPWVLSPAPQSRGARLQPPPKVSGFFTLRPKPPGAPAKENPCPGSKSLKNITIFFLTPNLARFVLSSMSAPEDMFGVLHAQGTSQDRKRQTWFVTVQSNCQACEPVHAEFLPQWITR